MKNDLEIGTKVKVNLRVVSSKNPYLSKRLMAGEIVPFITGYVKRIAWNGALGVEFDIRVTKPPVTEGIANSIYNLHGEGRAGYCLYFRPDDVAVVKNEVRPQGDIAQSMEDTMLDHEYGMDEDEYMYIVGF